jgi:mRNA interferase MazF
MTARRGQVWFLDFDPVTGHEQGGYRPALVLSSDVSNLTGVVTVLPLTSKHRPYRTRIGVAPPDGGVALPSWVIGEQPRSIDARRLKRLSGTVSAEVMAKVEDVVRVLLDL